MSALLLQGLALLGVMVLAVAWSEMPLGPAALLQGLLAALLSAWLGLPRWWWPIQFFFPLLLLSGAAAAIAPLWWALAFLALAAVYWSTWRTRVPLFLSGRRAWEEVAALLPAQPVRVVDIGSGLGGLVLYLARQRPDCELSGIEIAPLPWLYSWLRARLGGSRARFLLGDYRGLDLQSVDVLFAYLSPAAMPALWESVQGRLRPGALLLSYEFPVPGVPPALTVACGSRVLYGWRMP